MRQELPVEGRGPTELARMVELAAVPRDREESATEAWPTPDAIVVLRRGSLPRVPCDMRYVNRASCLSEYVQRIGWDGEAGPRPRSRIGGGALLERLRADLRRGAVGRRREQQQPGRRRALRPDATTPGSPLDAPIDATANIVAVTGGVAVFPSDGSAWMADDGPGMAFARVETTPPPLVGRHGPRGAARGIDDDALRTALDRGLDGGGVHVFASPPADGSDDVLLRMIDAHSRVREDRRPPRAAVRLAPSPCSSAPRRRPTRSRSRPTSAAAGSRPPRRRTSSVRQRCA
ncbi:MAG: hypothetical protein R3B82_20545 [Sandaracinaceae bacterium]